MGLQTQEATSIVSYSCSKRVIPIPTSYLTARRSAFPLPYIQQRIVLLIMLPGCAHEACLKAPCALLDILHGDGF